MLDIFYLIVLPAVRLILSVLWLALVIRAVLSWLPAVNNAFTSFIYGITEIFLRPVRSITNRFGGRSLPIDVSFLAVMIVVTLLLNVL